MTGGWGEGGGEGYGCPSGLTVHLAKMRKGVENDE